MPTDEQALQFAVMLKAGLPASQAILYFCSGEDPGETMLLMKRWVGSSALKKAQRRLMQKDWAEMSLEEKARMALDQHYAGLAYLLMSQHYAEADPQGKAKLDSARTSLEAKLAGQAGKQDALSVFFADLRSGRLQLPKAG